MKYLKALSQYLGLLIRFSSLILLFVATVSNVAFAAPPGYAVQFIGDFPKAVNNAGDAVGYSRTVTKPCYRYQPAGIRRPTISTTTA